MYKKKKEYFSIDSAYPLLPGVDKSEVCLGKFGVKDAINILNAAPCSSECPFLKDESVDCHHHNGDHILVLHSGITRETVERVRQTAFCVRK